MLPVQSGKDQVCAIVKSIYFSTNNNKNVIDVCSIHPASQKVCIILGTLTQFTSGVLNNRKAFVCTQGSSSLVMKFTSVATT